MPNLKYTNPDLKLQDFHLHQWILDPELPPMAVFRVSSLKLHRGNVPTNPASANSGWFCLTSLYSQNKIGPVFWSSSPSVFLNNCSSDINLLLFFHTSEGFGFSSCGFLFCTLTDSEFTLLGIAPTPIDCTSIHERKTGKRVHKNCSGHRLTLKQTNSQYVRDIAGWSISLLPPHSTVTTNHLGTSETRDEKRVLLISMRLWPW